MYLSLLSVFADVDGQSTEQGRLIAGLYSHREECFNRDQSTDSHPKNIPPLLWPNG